MKLEDVLPDCKVLSAGRFFQDPSCLEWVQLGHLAWGHTSVCPQSGVCGSRGKVS